MPQTETRQVMEQAMKDESFLSRFRADPESALEEYDLEEEEREAFATKSDERIREVIGDARADIVVVIII